MYSLVQIIPLVKRCTLTNKADGTIWRALSKPPKRRHGPYPRPFNIGTWAREQTARSTAYFNGCPYIFLIYYYNTIYVCVPHFYDISALVGCWSSVYIRKIIYKGSAVVNRFNHTSGVTTVTPTDRPKSVHNRCVIKIFGGVFYVVTLLFGFLCGCRGFCHITESDLFLFLFEQVQSQGRTNHIREWKIKVAFPGEKNKTCDINFIKFHSILSKLHWHFCNLWLSFRLCGLLVTHCLLYLTEVNRFFTFQSRIDLPYFDWTEASKLSKSQLQVEQRYPDHYQAYKVWDQKGTWRKESKMLYEFVLPLKYFFLNVSNFCYTECDTYACNRTIYFPNIKKLELKPCALGESASLSCYIRNYHRVCIGK